MPIPPLTQLLIFILAFCSIVYELLLAQALSAFLENTVLRYCVTIGLYMFSMGLGSLAAEGKWTKNPVLTLLKVELFLTVIGGFSLPLLHVLNMVDLPRIAFSIGAHGLIIIIGLLTGLELPLFFEILRSEKNSPENLVLGINYLGAFTGTVCFAGFFYPVAGLMATAFLAGSLNALAGVSLITLRPTLPAKMKRAFNGWLLAQTMILVVIFKCLLFSTPINEFFMSIYMNQP